ncbi:MAG: tRNA (adenosine(37)-N6)-dimethylallyltransferase MiaA, partial [Bacteroidales bacterium]|nr:tRNA (adenosine(37)-N6)-dimethylallyltransferase MiaA [Bacteroidales bacterium]
MIIISGPTAIGKTSVAIHIAKDFGAEIISADSRQFYKEMKIGTAAPSDKELEAVKHHFTGHLSVTGYYNVSRFENDVLEFLELYFKTNNHGVVVGGSGLYIDAVCKGIDELPDPDETLRNKLKESLKKDGINVLKNQLKKLDPDYYKVVDLNNPNRILRALEVCLMTGKTYTSLRNNNPKPRDFEIIKIGLNRPRQELVEIIHKRVDKMIENGLIDEVKSLTKFRDLNALNTVGYKEIFKYIDGDWPLDLAIEKIKTNTRRYAKRQMTWFNRD